MTLLELIISISAITNLITVVALKYGIENWYLQQRVPHWFPESFCLLCFSFWTGLGTAMSLSLFIPITTVQLLVSIVATPTIVVMLHK